MRSMLFVPGDRPDRFGKALDSGADGVIVDLEDAVAPERKVAARDGLVHAIGPERPVLLRINAPGTPWFEADLSAASRLDAVRAIVLPKAEQADDVARVAAVKPVWLLIETALGLQQAAQLGRVSGVVGLAFGAIDFQLDLGIRDDNHGLTFFRLQLVWQARLAGLPAPIDGVCTALGDEAVLDAECQRARDMGFGGKLCLHPRQIETVQRAFGPSADERHWAQRVIDAAAAAGGAAVRLDGQMIDRPVVLRAEAILRSTR